MYFDHNASTPVRPEVVEAMTKALRDLGANPSSAHRAGQTVRAAVEKARGQVAALVHARPEDVVFVSGGTEGDHLAVVGAAWAQRAKGKRVAFAALEHHAVHGATEVLAELGWSVEHLPCDANGLTDPAGVESLPADTTVVSLMLANNETGVIQPVADLATRAHARGMLVHCDAVQAVGKVPVDVDALEIDFLVLSGHKFGGPKGAGALIVRGGAPLESLFRGSAHERGRRGGTENVPGIVGLGLAAELAAAELTSERTRLRQLRDRFELGLKQALPEIVIHGVKAPRLPNTINVSFPGARSDHLLVALDSRGISASAGAACASGGVEPSPVLSAMGVARELAVCAIRFSFGRGTTADDVDESIPVIASAVKAARASNAPLEAGA